MESNYDQIKNDLVVSETTSLSSFITVALIDLPNALTEFIDEKTNTLLTLPDEFIFCGKNVGSYAILERHNVKNKLYLNNHLQINMEGIVDKISLLDFPYGQYILSINGNNCITAQYNNMSHTYEFNLSKKTHMLDILRDRDIAFINSGAVEPIKHKMINAPIKPSIYNIGHMDNQPITYTYDPPITDRENYINLINCDIVKIIVPANINLDDKHLIRLDGYFLKDYNYDRNSYSNNRWTDIKSSNYISIYPYSTYTLGISHPTESIDIKADTSDGIIIIYINGYKLCSFTSSVKLVRVKFNNPTNLFMGAENNHLSDAINERSINMSRINNISIIARNCKIVELYQSYYVIYHRSTREPVYAN